MPKQTLPSVISDTLAADKKRAENLDRLRRDLCAMLAGDVDFYRTPLLIPSPEGDALRSSVFIQQVLTHVDAYRAAIAAVNFPPVPIDVDGTPDEINATIAKMNAADAAIDLEDRNFDEDEEDVWAEEHRGFDPSSVKTAGAAELQRGQL